MCRINLRCFFKALWYLIKGLGLVIGIFAAGILGAIGILLAVAAVLWVIYFITTLDPMILVAIVIAFLAYITISNLFGK